MKNIRLIYLIPAALLLPLIVGLGKLSWFRGLREVILEYVDTLFWAWDLAWVWLSGPPVWATSLALAVMVLIYIFNLINLKRWLRAGAFVFKKDARQAQLKFIADDETVKAFRLSMLAQRLLSEGRFEPIPPLELPVATSVEEYKPLANPGDYMLACIPPAAQNPAGIIRDLFEWLEQFAQSTASGNELIASLDDIRKKCDKLFERTVETAFRNREQWERLQKGRVFFHPDDQIHWHLTRLKVDAANRLMKEIENRLLTISRSWGEKPDAWVIRALIDELHPQIFENRRDEH